VEKVESNQLGEDLMLQVRLTAGHDPKNLELRSRESQDTARGLYRYTIDIGGSGNVERARSALGSIGSGDVTGCAASFDDACVASSIPSSSLARCRRAATSPIPTYVRRCADSEKCLRAP